MENQILKKRLNTFRTAKGTLTRVSDDLIIDVLRAWEQWAGTAVDFYRDIGLKKNQLWPIIKKAKKLVKGGYVCEHEFKEIQIEGGAGMSLPATSLPCSIELSWDKNKVIRFGGVDLLLEFLKKAA